MTLDEAIAACIAEKQGNNEFALFHTGGGSWVAEIGNPTNCVMLGEVGGEISTWGEFPTPLDAVVELLRMIREANAAPKAKGEDPSAKYGILAYDPPPLTEDEVEAKYGGSILDRAA